MIDISNVDMSALLRHISTVSEEVNTEVIKTKGFDLVERTNSIQVKREEELQDRIDARNHRPHPILQAFAEVLGKVFAPIISAVSAIVSVFVPVVGQVVVGVANALVSVTESLSNFFIDKKINEQQGKFLQADIIKVMIEKSMAYKEVDIDLIENMLASNNSNMIVARKIEKAFLEAEAMPVKNISVQQRG